MAKKSPSRSAKKKAPAKKSLKKTPARKAPVKKKTAAKKAPAKKKAPVKKMAKKPAKKVAPKKKAITKKTVKKATKKVAPKKTAVDKKTAPPAAAKKKAVGKKSAAPKAAPKKSVKTTPTKKAPAKKKVAAQKTAPTEKTPAAKKSAPTKKAVAKSALKSRLTKGKATKKTASIGFSLDEVKEIAKKSAATEKEVAKKKADNAKEKAAALEAQIAAAKPSKVAPASLADILGFNPSGGNKASYDDPKAVPAKFRKYYKLLLELRTHLTGQIDQHAEETLKRSSKDDAGDLSSYGQHMADAGTDTFDRDFALSLVANEQEALAEIEAAIQRIKKGTFGFDEVTGDPIDKDRLTAVPFTRYSAETQKNLERNRHRVRTQAGLGGEMGDNTIKITDPNADE